MKIYIKNLGCKSNRYEAEKIAEVLNAKNIYVDFEKMENADFCIVNTCTVTHTADRKSRQAINFIKNKYPNAKIIVFGCGPRVDAEEYKKLKGVYCVCKSRDEVLKLVTAEPAKICERKRIDSRFCGNDKNNCGNDKKISPLAVLGRNDKNPLSQNDKNPLSQNDKNPLSQNDKNPLSQNDNRNYGNNRTRALIKIQDGCDNYCSYCIIPYSRGNPISRPLEEIVSEIIKKEKEGFKEIVITGININKYNNNGINLTDLLQQILKKTSIPRIRLSSIEPMQVTDKFIEIFGDKRFCKHIHASLQSGSDKILKLMNRRYNRQMYLNMCKKLIQSFPGIALTTDIIVGFPNETDCDFKESINFSKKIGFSKIHVFKYSKRKGTKAAGMDHQIFSDIKNKRSNYLRNLSTDLRKKFLMANIGKKKNVLFENKNNKDYFEGLTGNYIKIYIKSDEDLKKSIRKVNLLKIFKDGILGEVI